MLKRIVKGLFCSTIYKVKIVSTIMFKNYENFQYVQ